MDRVLYNTYILVNIFEYLDLNSKLNASRVCRIWNDTMRTKRVWDNITKLNIGEHYNDIEEFLHVMRNIITLYIDDVNDRMFGTVHWTYSENSLEIEMCKRMENLSHVLGQVKTVYTNNVYVFKNYNFDNVNELHLDTTTHNYLFAFAKVEYIMKNIDALTHKFPRLRAIQFSFWCWNRNNCLCDICRSTKQTNICGMVKDICECDCFIDPRPHPEEKALMHVTMSAKCEKPSPEKLLNLFQIVFSTY